MTTQQTQERVRTAGFGKCFARLGQSIFGGHSRSRNTSRRRSLLLERMEDRRLLTVVDLASLLSIQGTAIYGAEAGDQSGRVGNAGDMNGDGFDDFVLGASGADASLNAKPDAGESFVIFGGPSLPATLDLANLGSAGIRILGADAGDALRGGRSAGDVNADGYDDIILQSPGADAAGNFKPDAGESYVIFGGASLPPTIDLASPGSGVMTIFGADSGDAAFVGSGTGDVNADGYDDLIIGAIRADGVDNLNPDAGEGYIVFGGPSLPASIDLASLGTAGVTTYGANAGDNAGYRVSGAGDVNGDGVDDVIIGAQQAGSGGESYVVFGDPALGQSGTIDLGILGSAGVTIRGAAQGGLFGRSVDSAGDVNGDGYGDVIIGSVVDDSFVIYGGATLPAMIDVAALGSSGVKLAGVIANWGASGAGDVNGDGFDELIVGDSAGKTYVVFGGSTLSQMIDLKNLGTAGVSLSEIDAGDRAGQYVSRAGDVNDDGYSDILIGAIQGDGVNNSREGAGEAYLVYGGADFPGVQVVFEESFEVAEWNGTWVEDSQNDWFRSTQRASDQAWSAEVDGSANNSTLALNNSLDLSWTSAASMTFDWLIEGGFDSGEYVALDVSTDGGANWIQGVRQLNGNQSQEDVWHSEVLDLTPYATGNVEIRFRASVSTPNEDANVDNIRIVGAALGPNTPPTANAGGPYAVDEGSSIQLNAASSSDPDGSIASYAWDFDGDGFYDDATGATPGYIEIISGVHAVAVQVTDNRGATDTATTTVTVNNVAPTANAGPDQTANINTPVNLSASASSDPGNDIVAYAWDLDNDGQYDDASGVNAVFSSGAIGTYPVGLHVTDTDGAISTDSVSITITDAPVDPAIYVGNIYDVFETRQRGHKKTDHRLVIDVLQDDGNGIADAGDTGIGGVFVVVDLFDSSDNLVATLTGTTDSAGVFRSDWIRGLDPGDYRADVVDLVLAGFTWDPFLDLEDEETLNVP